MNTFFVVIRHTETGLFSNLNYETENDVLEERDLLKIEEFHADKSSGITEIKTQIISWQKFNVERW